MIETDLYRWPACLNGTAHLFGELNYSEDTKKVMRRDLVAWGWCSKCGSTVEIYAGNNEPAVITRPKSFEVQRA